MNEWRNYEEIKRYYEAKNNCKRYCKCGHYAYIMNKYGIAECTWCHNLIFMNKEVEFKYRMNQQLIKERRNRK